MIKVGITGGIGSGKTAFCKEWEKLGAYVIYADDFAKKLMHEDEKLRQKIIAAFGEKSYNKDGSLNRAYLAEEAFEKGRVEELNNLVHPLLWKRVNKIAAKKEKAGVSIFAIEAAILLNNGRPKNVDYVILLQSDREERAKRVVERDKVDEHKVVARMQNQPDFSTLSHLSDYMVMNDGTLADLNVKARKLYEELIKIS